MWETRTKDILLTNSNDRFQSSASLEDALTATNSFILNERRERSSASNFHIALKFHVRSFVPCKLLKKYLILKKKINSFNRLDGIFVQKTDLEKFPKYFRLFMKFNRLMAWKSLHTRRHYR